MLYKLTYTKTEEIKMDFMLCKYDSQFYTLFNALSLLDKTFLLITVSYSILAYFKIFAYPLYK